MRAPAFWSQEPPSPLARLLSPAGRLYGAVSGHRMSRPGARASVPVICIGNLTLGGAGKTPTALAVAGFLREAGGTPVFLTRGYGGRVHGPVRVELGDNPEKVGDEPLLLAASGPTVLARDRVAGVRRAVEAGASAIVMDDGLQNPSVDKDLSIAVVDGAAGIGNGFVFPAGPLRAPLAAQWPRIHALLVVGEGHPGDGVADAARSLGKPVLRGRLVPDAAVAARLKGERVLAFAGIGRPEKFFETLRACGAVPEVARAFPDHHPFTEAEIAWLEGEAAQRGLRLITTEKDALRAARPTWPTLPVRLEAEGLREFMLTRLRAAPPAS